MPPNHRSQLLSTVAHAYLKDALELAEQCRAAMRCVVSTLPSHADERILLLQYHCPETLEEFDQASEARAKLRWKWLQMCEKLGQQILLQKSTFSQTLSRLAAGHTMTVKFYRHCKTARNNILHSTTEQRREALQSFETKLKLIACIDSRVNDEDALVAFAYLKYWDTLESLRKCLESLVEVNFFDGWLASVKVLQQAIKPVHVG
jgi:hypothetical protein